MCGIQMHTLRVAPVVCRSILANPIPLQGGQRLSIPLILVEYLPHAFLTVSRRSPVVVIPQGVVPSMLPWLIRVNPQRSQINAGVYLDTHSVMPRVMALPVKVCSPITAYPIPRRPWSVPNSLRLIPSTVVRL